MPATTTRRDAALELHGEATRAREQLAAEAQELRRAGKIRQARVAEKSAAYLEEHMRGLEQHIGPPPSGHAPPR